MTTTIDAIIKGCRLHFLACHDSKKMDASGTCHGNGIDSRGINLEIVIRDAYSGNSLIKIIPGLICRDYRNTAV